MKRVLDGRLRERPRQVKGDDLGIRVSGNRRMLEKPLSITARAVAAVAEEFRGHVVEVGQRGEIGWSRPNDAAAG